MAASAAEELVHEDRYRTVAAGCAALATGFMLVAGHPQPCCYFGLQLWNRYMQSLDYRYQRVAINKHEADGLRKITGISESDLERVDSEDTLTIGDVEIRFLHTPGHTPGSQCFLARDALVSGDTLFVRGCGRVDLPGSDPAELHQSLRRLAGLPEQTVLYPGHQYSEESQSTIGQELATNPYLRIPTEEMWRELMGY